MLEVKRKIESLLQADGDEIEDSSYEETPEATIAHLSTLSIIDYESVREDVAKKLKFRTSVLDKEVAKFRKESEQDECEVVINDEPFQGDVDIGQLLSEIEALINKHMILPKGALPAVTLWIVATYIYDAFRVFPKLAIISPEKRCGKTTMLDILSGLTSSSLLAANITPSAIFRSIDLWKPTLIIDEADTFLSGRNDDLIGIINSGHTKTTAFVIRTVGEDFTPTRFSTWSPMAFASIKGIAGTVMDRSIIIQLRRKMLGESVKRLPVDFKFDCNLIRQKLVKWGDTNFNYLKTNTVEPPEIPNDRAIDNWLPLFTIASAIDADWLEKINTSFIILNSMDEEETAAVMLLRDIREVFKNKDKFHSHELVNELVTLEERPWCEWRKGNSMTQNSLAKILGTFNIHSKQIRIANSNKRGFELSQFEDAFARYVPDTPIQSVTTLQAMQDKGCSQIQSATEKNNVTLQKPLKPIYDAECSTVTLQNNDIEEEVPFKESF